jgi:hypothetical protein
MAYNYLDAVKDDVRQVIEDEYVLSDYPDRDAFEEELRDVLWADDSVTGNGSGSYTYDRAKAREYVQGDPDAMDYIRELISEFDEKDVALEKFLSEDWEWFDVSIRCYLLDQAISEVLDELYGE